MTAPDDELDPYAVLEVSPDADQRALRAAYRALARRYHPDLSEAEEDRLAMIRLNRAWEMVGAPGRRKATDDGRRPKPPPAPPPASTAGGVPTWEERNGPLRKKHGWGAGAAGPPPGRPSGSKLDFGIYLGWTLGEIAREDPGYLEWLSLHREGEPFADEIKALRAARNPTPPPPRRRRGIFRRG